MEERKNMENKLESNKQKEVGLYMNGYISWLKMLCGTLS